MPHRHHRGTVALCLHGRGLVGFSRHNASCRADTAPQYMLSDPIISTKLCIAQDFYLASYGVVERWAARSRVQLPHALEQGSTLTAFRANTKMHARCRIDARYMQDSCIQDTYKMQHFSLNVQWRSAFVPHNPGNAPVSLRKHTSTQELSNSVSQHLFCTVVFGCNVKT